LRDGLGYGMVLCYGVPNMCVLVSVAEFMVGCQRKRLNFKNYEARVVYRVLYPVIGLFAWTVFSFAMVENSIENFNNKEKYLILGLSHVLNG